MSRFYRFLVSIIAAIAFYFYPSSAHAQPLSLEYFGLGVDKMLTGSYEKAINLFTQAIQLKSDFVGAYSNRCLAYLQIEDYEDAIADCTQAITLVASNAEAYLHRGVAYYRQGSYVAAIADISQAIRLKPEDFRAYYNRAIALSAIGNHLSAIRDYNQALSQTPTTANTEIADIYNDRGLTRFELKDFSGAIADFSQAINLNANNSRAYYNRGCVCQKRGDERRAVQDFTLSLRLNPANAQAYVNRGIARYKLGYQQTAIEDIQQAAKGFFLQGDKTAFQKTINLLQQVQRDTGEWEVATSEFWILDSSMSLTACLLTAV